MPRYTKDQEEYRAQMLPSLTRYFKSFPEAEKQILEAIDVNLALNPISAAKPPKWYFHYQNAPLVAWFIHTFSIPRDQIAELLGVCPRTIDLYLNGKMSPKDPTKSLLASLYFIHQKDRNLDTIK